MIVLHLRQSSVQSFFLTGYASLCFPSMVIKYVPSRMKDPRTRFDAFGRERRVLSRKRDAGKSYRYANIYRNYYCGKDFDLPSPPSNQKTLFTVTVTTNTGKILHLQNIDASISVESLKAKVYAAEGIGPQQQRLIYKGRQLYSGRTLNDYGIRRGCSLDLLLKYYLPTPESSKRVYVPQKYYLPPLCIARLPKYANGREYNLFPIRKHPADDDMNDALWWACSNGHFDLVKNAIFKGWKLAREPFHVVPNDKRADIEYQRDWSDPTSYDHLSLKEPALFKSTALHQAAMNGHFDVCTLLVSAGWSTHQTDKDGFTPGDDAEAAGHADIALFLQSKRSRLKAQPENVYAAQLRHAKEGHPLYRNVSIRQGQRPDIVLPYEYPTLPTKTHHRLKTCGLLIVAQDEAVNKSPLSSRYRALGHQDVTDNEHGRLGQEPFVPTAGDIDLNKQNSDENRFRHDRFEDNFFATHPLYNAFAEK